MIIAIIIFILGKVFRDHSEIEAKNYIDLATIKPFKSAKNYLYTRNMPTHFTECNFWMRYL